MFGFIQAQQVIVTDDASYTTPASSSVLDVKSTSKGFLPPRVALTSNKDVSTIASPTNGLLIYNTGTGGLIEKGIYYWCDSVWIKPLSGGNGSTNYLKIANDGNVTLMGTATTFTDLVVNPATVKNNEGSAPTWTKFVDPNMYALMFANGVSNEVDFCVQMPHNYKEGSRIYPHVHWSSTSAPGTQRVKWVMDYQWVNLGDNFVSSSSTSIYGTKIVPDNTTSLVAFQSTITALNTGGVDNAGIDGTGKKISSLLMCHFYRLGTDVTDTFSGTAAVLSIDFHYEIDSFGSHTEFTK